MSDLFPELEHLAGGKKRHWIEQNRELIVALNDKVGFRETARLLHMKPGTLVVALEQAEKSQRPVITLAEKAMGRAVLNENKINEIMKELDIHAEVLATQGQTVDQLRGHLADFFQFQAAANKLMASVMSSVETIRIERNFTEQLSSKPQRKVGPSHRIGSSRLSVYHGPRRNRLPGPVSKGRSQHRGRSRGV